ncbi:hypothetical protein [Enterococcus rotai]|uniref:hypothetical protein n=1 Tax=Enterococcus rotai TaxID=118060 RepID=UPI0035C72D8D
MYKMLKQILKELREQRKILETIIGSFEEEKKFDVKIKNELKNIIAEFNSTFGEEPNQIHLVAVSDKERLIQNVSIPLVQNGNLCEKSLHKVKN